MRTTTGHAPVDAYQLVLANVRIPDGVLEIHLEPRAHK